MTIRCTQRLLKAMGIRPRELADVPVSEDDWSANLLWFDRRKCLLLTHAGTLFPLFIADVLAADLRRLDDLLERNARTALYDERLSPDALGDLSGAVPLIARTTSRRILGVMTEDTRMCEYAIASAGGLEHTDVLELNRSLRHSLHSVEGGYATALETLHERLAP